MSAGVVTRDFTMTATIHTDWESAERLKDAFELVAGALCEPTEENTSALFHLAAGCIVARAQADPGAVLRPPTPEGGADGS